MGRSLKDIRTSLEHRDITSFVFISSLTLFIPTFMSMFKMPFIVTIILFSATIFSSLYHSSNELDHNDLDVWWANLTSLLTVVLFTLVSLNYKFFSWNVLVPLFLGGISLYFYFIHGALPENPTEKDVRKYDLWHGIWHILSTLTVVSLLLSNIKFTDMSQPYINVYKKNVSK